MTNWNFGPGPQTGTMGPWTEVPDCRNVNRVFACQCTAYGLQGMSQYLVRVREMCEETRRHSDYALTPMPTWILPIAASAPTQLGWAYEDHDLAGVTMNVSWTPGAPNECTFKSWQIQVKAEPQEYVYIYIYIYIYIYRQIC